MMAGDIRSSFAYAATPDMTTERVYALV